jgi:hypothetical protein
MGVKIQKMSIRDYDEMLALWRQCEGVGLSVGDGRADLLAARRVG